MTQEAKAMQDAVNIVPGRHVLVRITTADSAQDIIDMAFTLMKPGEGHVTVLGNPTFVDVVVISDLEPESEAFQSEVRSAEEALEEALDIPVRLSVEISAE